MAQKIHQSIKVPTLPGPLNIHCSSKEITVDVPNRSRTPSRAFLPLFKVLWAWGQVVQVQYNGSFLVHVDLGVPSRRTASWHSSHFHPISKFPFPPCQLGSFRRPSVHPIHLKHLLSRLPRAGASFSTHRILRQTTECGAMEVELQ